MSLLSSTQGRPERIRSLVALLRDHQAPLSRAEVIRWLQPGSRAGESDSAASQTLDCARSLGFVETQGKHVVLSDRTLDLDHAAFADRIHRALVETENPADRVLLEAYATFVVRTDQEGGTDWIGQSRSEDLADAINAAVTGPDYQGKPRFNSTKYAPWRSWMVYVGLGWEFERIVSFYPSPTARLERELLAIAEKLGVEQEVPAEDFLATVAEHMPYVDGGTMFHEAAQRMAFKPANRQVSRLLSAALRDLEELGAIALHQRGDASGAYLLSRDPAHPIAQFAAITIRRPA